jgi:MFS family permease
MESSLKKKNGGVIQRFSESWHGLNEKYLITPKLLYFFLNLEVYAFYVFKGTFIKKYLGIEPKPYGYLMAFMASVGFPFVTVWGKVADTTGKPKLVLTFLALATAGSFQLLMFFVGGKGSTPHFIWVTFSLGVYSLFFSGLIPLMDLITLKILSSNPAFSKEMYGRQRMFGTLGYCVSTLMGAFLMDKIGDASLFGIVPACAVIFCVILFFAGPSDKKEIDELPGQSESQNKNLKSQSEESLRIKAQEDQLEKEMLEKMPAWRQKIKWPLLRLLSDAGYLFFLLAVFMTGCARSVMTNFLSLYWEDKMHLKKPTVAFAAIFGVLIELFIFFFSNYLLFMGIYWKILFGQFSMALRCWLYVVLPPIESLFPAVFTIELLKGSAFGFTQLAGIKVASMTAPPSLQATSQAIYNSFYTQLPAVLATAAGGKLYDDYGPLRMFIITSCISTLGFVAFTVKWGWDGSIGIGNCRRRRNSLQQLPPIHVK